MIYVQVCTNCCLTILCTRKGIMEFTVTLTPAGPLIPDAAQLFQHNWPQRFTSNKPGLDRPTDSIASRAALTLHPQVV